MVGLEFKMLAEAAAHNTESAALNVVFVIYNVESTTCNVKIVALKTATSI